MTRRELRIVQRRPVDPVTETICALARTRAQARASFAELGWGESHWEAFWDGWYQAWRSERWVAA